MAAGALTVSGFQDFIESIEKVAREDPEAALSQMRTVVLALCAAFSVGLLTLSLWLASLSRRTVASGTFPPPGVRVLGQSEAKTGDSAVFAARMGFAFAALFAFCAVIFPLMTWWLMNRAFPG